MNAVDALAEWWTVSEEMGLQRYGYVFRSRRFGSDEVSVLAEDRMVWQSQYSPTHICTDITYTLSHSPAKTFFNASGTTSPTLASIPALMEHTHSAVEAYNISMSSSVSASAIYVLGEDGQKISIIPVQSSGTYSLGSTTLLLTDRIS